ncbi:hypothetical protein [Halocatena halophila]|uniref:hypothetical protein n=1 Tax=Halocatena halophila TaxID=2814576 RepID=UPI002ED3B16C
MAIRTALFAGLIGAVTVIEPVAAQQTGIGLLRDGVCGSKAAPLITAAWAAGVMWFGGKGLIRLSSGLSDIRGVDSSKVAAGRQKLVGSFPAFGASLVLLSAERLLAYIGIPLFDCIRLSFGG